MMGHCLVLGAVPSCDKVLFVMSVLRATGS